MGILDWLMKITGKKEEKGLVVEKMEQSEPTKAYPDDSRQEKLTEVPAVGSVDEHQTVTSEHVGQLNRQLQTVESVDKHQAPFMETRKEPQRTTMTEQSTHMAIKQWEDTIKVAQQHPLSQVKIINTQILEELNAVLKTMDHRLEKLDDLDKLDIILDLLESTKQELESKGVSSAALNDAITQINQLTIKDKDVIDWIGRQERVTAQQLADFLNLSRSTASFRLNRLSELGALDKEAIGKKIYYKIRKQGE
jgi:DNA-binding transcriptional ArsR family regulator